jgi:pimeloyl-ACP methyl ester carboxylesterase
MTITVVEKVINGIPLVEYQSDGQCKGLTFVQHGYESNKVRGGEFLAMYLARLGYHVVSIDAYKHGDRAEEPFITGTGYYRLKEAFFVIEQTANDIISLFETVYKTYQSFDMVGVSLGGMVGYLVATKTDKVNRLIPIISTPDFHKQAYAAISAAGIDTAKFFTKEKLAYIHSIDPIQHLDKMQYQSLAIFVSDNDDVVPPRPSLKFMKQYHHQIDAAHVYSCKHTVSREMQEDVLSFVAGEKISL